MVPLHALAGRRWSSRLLAGTSALALIFLAGCGVGADASPNKLKLADSYSPSHMFARYGVEGFLSTVAAPGEGRIEVEYYPSGQLGSARDIANLTQAGSVHISPAAPSYLSDQLPLSSVTDLAGMAEDSCVASKSILSLLSEDGILYKEEYEPRGLRPLWVAVIPQYEILTSSHPVTEPDHLRGLTIRSSGGAMDSNIRALGGAPVSMTGADTYEALSRHTVDGVTFPYPSVAPYRLEEVLNYATKGVNLGSFAMPYVIAEEAWQELTEPQQRRVELAAAEASERLCRGIMDETPPAEVLMRDAGVEIIELTEEQTQRFHEGLEPVKNKWAEQLDEAGYPGSEVLEAYEQAVKHYGASEEARTP